MTAPGWIIRLYSPMTSNWKLVMVFRKKKKDLEMEINSRKDSYPTSRSNCRKCGRESSPHWRILQKQYFVDDKQWVPEDTLEKSRNVGQGQVEQHAQALESRRWRFTWSLGLNVTPMWLIFSVSMADKMVRLSLLKESMQWGCFWSIEDPQIYFSFPIIMVVKLGKQLT